MFHAFENLNDNDSVHVGINGLDRFQVIILLGACVDTSECTLVYHAGIDEEQGSKIRIYPNPGQGAYYLDFGTKSAETHDISLRDLRVS